MYARRLHHTFIRGTLLSVGDASMRSIVLVCGVSLLFVADNGAAQPPKVDANSLLGRWDLTVTGETGTYPAWLEIRRSGYRTLVGSYVGQFGSARPIAEVIFDQGTLRFTVPPQWERRTTNITFEGKFDGTTLKGETTDDNGKRLSWVGQRAPTLVRTAEPTWGEPLELFNGRNLTGWQARHAAVKNGWVVREGVLVNATPGNDLRTNAVFTDFKLHAEFRYPKGSNSGIYLRGRYEVQIEDNFGQAPDCHKVGSVYGFLTPSRNAAKAPGEWQSIDITLIGREVTIIFNGERIIDRQTIPGITGGALDSAEGEPGPVLLQGDHGPVEFRKLTLTPAR